jgi:hypothetical protein
VVPLVLACTYARVREGRHVFAERVKKKSGTKWDRDQRCITPAGQCRAAENDADALRRPQTQNAPAASCGRSWPILKQSFHVRERRGLTWQGWRLMLCWSDGLLVSSKKPDPTWPAMRRVRVPDHLTDLVSPSRAKDAIASLALAVPNPHQEGA